LKALAFVLVVALDGCGGAGDSALTVYAAASLRDAFTELAQAYEAASGTRVVLSFDASSTLRTQIEQGAPADVFASADSANVEALTVAGLVRDQPRTFARNRLAIVAPAAASGETDAWQALASPAVRIVAAGEDVPITRYARELIDNLAALPDAPPRFAEAYAASVVSEEDNVRAVMAKIELGEGDVGIVYETDARSSSDVTTVPIPDAANPTTAYPVVALRDGPAGADAADRFVAWLLREDAQAILAGHGFLPPE
jgi:molybdate transport system substrate-binding protein